MKQAVLNLPVSDRARLGTRVLKYGYPSSSNAMRETEKTKCFPLYKTATGDFLTAPQAPFPADVVSILSMESSTRSHPHAERDRHQYKEKKPTVKTQSVHGI